MVFRPPFKILWLRSTDYRTYLRMTKSESCRIEDILGSGVDPSVVAMTVAFSLKLQTISINICLTKNAGNELPVCDLLQQCPNDFSGFLEHSTRAPVGSDLLKFCRNAVMLSYKQ